VALSSCSRGPIAAFFLERRGRRCRRLLALLFFVALASVPAMGAEWKSLAAGATPALKLRDLHGQWRTLAEFRGSVVVINFWATWCEPCLEEMPSLQRLADRHTGKPLAIIGVNLGEGEARIQGFVDRTGTAFPMLLDRDGDAKKAWHVNGVPTTFVIDPRGRVRYVLVGAADFSAPRIESVITGLLPATAFNAASVKK
jgi:thiol-disulfide isomerase/thioredoxin